MYRSERANFVSDKLLAVYSAAAACILLFFSFFDNTEPIRAESETLLFNLISSVIPSNGLLPHIAAFILNLGTAAIIYFANRKYLFIRKETLFPVFFVILCGGMHNYCMNADIYCQLLVLIAIILFIDSYDRRTTVWNTCEIMMCIATASLISPSYIWYIFIFYIGFIIYNNFSWRDFFASLFGLAFPLFTALELLYIFGKDDDFFSHYATIFDTAGTWSPGYWEVAMTILGMLMALISFTEFLIHYSSDKTHQRKSMLFLFSFFALVAGMFYFYPGSISRQTNTYAMLGAICISHFFATNNTRFAAICFYTFSLLLIMLRGLEVFLT